LHEAGIKSETFGGTALNIASDQPINSDCGFIEQTTTPRTPNLKKSHWVFFVIRNADKGASGVKP
jgi:hypothetical protein